MRGARSRSHLIEQWKGPLLLAPNDGPHVISYAYEVDHRKYDDPDYVHEVPIQGGQVHAKRLPVGEDPLGPTSTQEGVTRDGEKPDDPHRYMGTVEACQGEEGAAETDWYGGSGRKGLFVLMHSTARTFFRPGEAGCTLHDPSRGWRTRRTQRSGTPGRWHPGGKYTGSRFGMPSDLPCLWPHTPYTIAMLLMSRTKVLTEVVGMSKTSSGKGPTRLWPRYTRYVEIRAPKNRQSEPRNSHMSNFRWFNPVAGLLDHHQHRGPPPLDRATFGGPSLDLCSRGTLGGGDSFPFRLRLLRGRFKRPGIRYLSSL